MENFPPMRNSFVIFEAIRLGNLEVVERALQDGWDSNILNPKTGFTPLTLACACNRVNITKTLLQSGAIIHIANRHGKTAMTYACETANEELLLLLLQYGGSPIECSANGDSRLLHVIDTAPLVFNDNNSLIDPTPKKDDSQAARCTKLLLEHGADSNAHNSTFSVLIHAVARAQTQCIKLLLENGADPNLTGCDKMTSLMYAAMFRSLDETKLPTILNSLLIHGTEVGAKSNTKRTAFDYALSSKSIIAMNYIWPYLSTEEQEHHLLTNIYLMKWIKCKMEPQTQRSNQKHHILQVKKCTIS